MLSPLIAHHISHIEILSVWTKNIHGFNLHKHNQGFQSQPNNGFSGGDQHGLLPRDQHDEGLHHSNNNGLSQIFLILCPFKFYYNSVCGLIYVQWSPYDPTHTPPSFYRIVSIFSIFFLLISDSFLLDPF